MPAATFPTLPPQEILDSCKAYGCPITIEDLQAPTPARAQAIYEWWMSRVLGLNAEDCVRAADAQLDRTFEDPREQALYREAMYLGVFAQALNQMLSLAAIDDFTTRDLSAPSVLRIRHVLSGVINFFLFEQEQAAEFLEPLQDEQEELAAQETKLLQRNEELRELLAGEKERRERNGRRVEELQGEHGARQAQLQEATGVGHRNAEWAKRSKQERVEAGEAIRKLEEATTSLNLQLSRLQENLLASPARMHSEMSQMSSELSSQQSKLRLVHDKLAHDERKVESLAKYTTDLGACIKLLEDYELDLGRVRETRARHDAHLAQLAALEEERADIRNNIKVLSSKLVNAVEALGRYNAKTEDKREGVRQRKAGLEAMQRELGVRRGRVAEEAAERNREAQLVEDEIRALHSEMHEELKRSEVAYNKIKDQVVAYSIALNAKIDSFNTLNSTDVNF